MTCNVQQTHFCTVYSDINNAVYRTKFLRIVAAEKESLSCKALISRRVCKFCFTLFCSI